MSDELVIDHATGTVDPTQAPLAVTKAMENRSTQEAAHVVDRRARQSERRRSRRASRVRAT